MLYLLFGVLLVLVALEAIMLVRFKGVPGETFHQRVGEIDADGFFLIEDSNCYLLTPAPPAFIRLDPRSFLPENDSYSGVSGKWTLQLTVATPSQASPNRLSIYARKVRGKVVAVTIATTSNQETLANELRASLERLFPEVNVSVTFEKVTFVHP